MYSRHGASHHDNSSIAGTHYTHSIDYCNSLHTLDAAAAAEPSNPEDAAEIWCPWALRPDQWCSVRHCGVATTLEGWWHWGYFWVWIRCDAAQNCGTFLWDQDQVLMRLMNIKKWPSAAGVLLISWSILQCGRQWGNRSQCYKI